MFLSRERALLCTASRVREFSVWGDRLLTPKGYKMITAHDMSAAMTFDSAGQKDGPPAKMILTSYFITCVRAIKNYLISHMM